jgi:two-component system cell cycle sensor histidine kinase/response regulator CckA
MKAAKLATNPLLESTQTRLNPARLALLYVLISAIWVAVSSELLFLEFESKVAITGFELAKGLGFVLASGALIYFIARRLLDRLLRSEESLSQSEAKHVLLQRQLAQAQKLEALGRLAAGITHDFNNILEVIHGSADLLRQESAALRSQDQARIQLILQAADRGANLTRQLLAFSRRQELVLRALNLNAVVGQATTFLRHLVGVQVTIELRLDPELWNVMGDATQINQVLMNLCLNARDAMPHGGTLEIQTSNVIVAADVVRRLGEGSPGPHVLLGVRDWGTGIPQDVLERMFEPFYTTKMYAQGIGLGLSTVYGIVKQSGGFIDVTTGMGKGTTFSVYLPRTTAAVIQAELSSVKG